MDPLAAAVCGAPFAANGVAIDIDDTNVSSSFIVDADVADIREEPLLPSSRVVSSLLTIEVESSEKSRYAVTEAGEGADKFCSPSCGGCCFGLAVFDGATENEDCSKE